MKWIELNRKLIMKCEKRTFSAFILTQVSLCTIGRHGPKMVRSFGASLSLMNSRYFTMEIALFQQSMKIILALQWSLWIAFTRRMSPLSSIEFVDNLYRKNEPKRIPSVSLQFSIDDTKKLLIQSCLDISPYFPICNPAYQFFYK